MSDEWTTPQLPATVGLSPQRAEWILKRVKRMLGAMSKPDVGNVDDFVIQLCDLLEGYDDDIVDYVTASKTGVQTRVRYNLKLFDVKEACDARVVALTRSKSTTARPVFDHTYTPVPVFHGSRAKLFVGEKHPRYQDILAWTKTDAADSPDWKIEKHDGRDGVWINYHLFYTLFVEQKRERTWVGLADADIVEHYKTYGLGKRPLGDTDKPQEPPTSSTVDANLKKHYQKHGLGGKKL